MRINKTFCVFGLLIVLNILVCNDLLSQIKDTLRTINTLLSHEDVSLFDFAEVRMETAKPDANPADVAKRQFQPVKEVFKKDEFQFPDSVRSFWIKFQIANNESNDTIISLIFRGGVSKAILFKAESDSLVLIGKTGFFYAVLARNVRYQDNRIDLILQAHSNTVYFIQVILYNNGIWLPKMPVLENFMYAETLAFKYEKEVNRLVLLWIHFFAGIFFMFFVFGLVKYLVLGKDKAYLYFSLMGLFLALATASQSQYLPLELPWFENIRGVELFDTLTTIVYIIQGFFVLEVLQLKIKYPRVTRLIKWYFLFKLLLAIINKILFFNYTDVLIVGILVFYVDVIIFFLLLITWVIYLATIRKGFYRFIFLGALTVFIAYTSMFILAYYQLINLLPAWFGEDPRARLFHFMAIAYVIDMLFYFAGLAYRDRQVEKDKIIFQEQLIQQLETNKELQEKFTGELEQQVKEKTAEVVKEKAEVESTLQELKSTQALLIQSAKMASLGELTAGVAHEIQNPLNFVNNFSEVNKEMIDELQIELKAGNTEEAIAISNDIKDNEEKINHHGKRADSIVKGMLEHSKPSTGQKVPTDINKLADEYLRLSYHGMRANDKSFNAEIKTDFDETLSAGEAGIGKINVVPQDIGRVLLNLYNNAFYAVNEKIKTTDENYKPTITVQTKKLNGKVEIKVEDNGNGISQKIVDKIFQPFFTTKPTGQGTGLGLSLSYDIVKAHGGEIKVETKEGEGAEFVIQLALKENV